MITIKSFCFNSFDENTYVVYDESGECVIIDPGCHLAFEERELADFIESVPLRPVRILQTHCHIDHILGCYFVSTRYKLTPEIHPDELPVMESADYVSRMYGINMAPAPTPQSTLREGEAILFGNSKLDVIFTPGHSPGCVSFYNREQKFVISGDVLFRNSIGRTDLPGGNYDVLMHSITTRLLPLGNDVTVYSGHGEETTIGEEKLRNPFLREHLQY